MLHVRDCHLSAEALPDSLSWGRAREPAAMPGCPRLLKEYREVKSAKVPDPEISLNITDYDRFKIVSCYAHNLALGRNYCNYFSDSQCDVDMT